MKVTSKPGMAVAVILMTLSVLFCAGVMDDIFLGVFAVFGIDTTPPTIGQTTPHSDGYVDISFIANQLWICYASDAGSGVQSATYFDSLLTAFLFEPVSLTNVGTHWEASWAGMLQVVYTSGSSYNYEFTVTDNAGNIATKSGVFTISYVNLAGDWKVKDSNDPAWTTISDPNDTYWFNDATLTFRFEKMSGAPSSEITCTLSGDYSATLAYASGVWEHTHTFSDGTYTITLKAEDTQGHVVQLSIFDLTIGGEPIGPEIVNFIIGIPLFMMGLAAMIMSTKWD